MLKGVAVFLWQEPDAADLVDRVGASLPDMRIIKAPDGIKDPSEAHIAGRSLPEFLEGLKAEAIPFKAIRKESDQARIAEAARAAAPVLAANDPLELVEKEIRRLGYGGDIRPALNVYLATTSRVLQMRPGTMPVHVLVMSQPSGGKSWTVGIVTRLLPRSAYHVIDAGSPRTLIYDDAPLQHRLVVFSEADSLPAGEDNPAASAIRNLLQDGSLHYSVVVRDPESGDFVVREIEKPGPTVMITTAIRPLGEQLMTRLFTLELADDPSQVQAALRTQAILEAEGAAVPDPCLIALQDYLQLRAPWDVSVPFARELAEAIGKTNAAPRMLRDFARLLSLIKAVAVLRSTHRRVMQGRVIADLSDYARVRELVNEMYADSLSGGSRRVRAVVETVARLVEEKKPGDADKITVTRIAAELGINRMAASRRVKAALRAGWLCNAESRKGYPHDLTVGEPLPDESGLPSPDSLVCNTVTPLTDSNTLPPIPTALLEISKVAQFVKTEPDNLTSLPSALVSKGNVR